MTDSTFGYSLKKYREIYQFIISESKKVNSINVDLLMVLLLNFLFLFQLVLTGF